MNKKLEYVEVLKRLFNDKGVLYLISSSEQKGGFMPDAVTRDEILANFLDDFSVKSIERTKLYGALGDMKGLLATILFKKI